MKVSGQPSLSRAATREKREREVAVDSSCDEVAFEGQDRSPRPFGDLPRCCSIVALALSQQDTSRDTRWELRQLLVYSGTAARRRREARRAMVFIRDGEILQDGDPRASAPGASPSQQTPSRETPQASPPQGQYVVCNTTTWYTNTMRVVLHSCKHKGGLHFQQPAAHFCC